MCFHQRLRVFTNLQTAQQALTKKREALVKAELASKSDRVSQFKDEVNEVCLKYRSEETSSTMCSFLHSVIHWITIFLVVSKIPYKSKSLSSI